MTRQILHFPLPCKRDGSKMSTRSSNLIFLVALSSYSVVVTYLTKSEVNEK